MGMFTTVIVGRVNPDDPEIEVQFKSGSDSCDTYRVGDEVRWWVDENRVDHGCLLDDVYHGESGQSRGEVNTHRNWWVCIKDHKIVEVVEWLRDYPPHTPPEITDKLDPPPWQIQYDQLKEKHGIPKVPPRELWTDAAWEQYDEAKAVHAEEYKRFRQAFMARQKVKHPETKPQELLASKHQIASTNKDELNAAFFEKLNKENDFRVEGACLIGYIIRRKMREPGFFRQIMPGYQEPETFTRPDGFVLRRGQNYDHFGRTVLLDRIYDNENMGVKHAKGTRCIVPPDELKELEAV